MAIWERKKKHMKKMRKGNKKTQLTENKKDEFNDDGCN